MAASAISIIQNTDASFDLVVTDDDGQPRSLVGAQLFAAVIDVSGMTVISKASADPSQIKLTDAPNGRAQLLFIPKDTVFLPLSGGGVSYTYKVVAQFSDGKVFDIVPPSLFEVTQGGVLQDQPPVFPNTVKVDHNYGGVDALRYMTPGGSPIAGAQIRLYFQSDYVAGRLDVPVGATLTDSYGRWTNPILVNLGYTYVVQFFMPGTFGPDIINVEA